MSIEKSIFGYSENLPDHDPDSTSIDRYNQPEIASVTKNQLSQIVENKVYVDHGMQESARMIAYVNNLIQWLERNSRDGSIQKLQSGYEKLYVFLDENRNKMMLDEKEKNLIDDLYHDFNNPIDSFEKIMVEIQKIKFLFMKQKDYSNEFLVDLN